MNLMHFFLRLPISIHAPHTRSDWLWTGLLLMVCSYFNPRPSYEERPDFPEPNLASSSFQSTPLIRGATFRLTRTNTRHRYFNPRPSYEERHWQQ